MASPKNTHSVPAAIVATLWWRAMQDYCLQWANDDELTKVSRPQIVYMAQEPAGTVSS